MTHTTLDAFHMQNMIQHLHILQNDQQVKIHHHTQIHIFLSYNNFYNLFFIILKYAIQYY